MVTFVRSPFGPSAQSLLGRAWSRVSRVRERATLRLGQIAKDEPLCREFGYGRGKPIDRHYIETFLAVHSDDIRGDVLEAGDNAYSKMFGGDGISRQHVIHVRPDHPGATICGDLSEPGVLPSEAFDCIILTQTLHLIFDLPRAVAQLHRSLRPGGVLLVTVPGVSLIDRGEWGESWYWSLTEAALRRVLNGPFEPADVTTRSYGNLYTATLFLHGAAVEDADGSKLDKQDPSYPVTVAARAVRAPVSPGSPARRRLRRPAR